MSITIKKIENTPDSMWDRLWWDCKYATYFHSREWAEVLSKYTKGKIQPDPLLITFSDGKQAILPLSSRKSYKGLIKTSLSSPLGTYGGWISVDELNSEHAALLVEYLTNKLGNLIWRINPYDKLCGLITFY